jgi:hypothetical protein
MDSWRDQREADDDDDDDDDLDVTKFTLGSPVARTPPRRRMELSPSLLSSTE